MRKKVMRKLSPTKTGSIFDLCGGIELIGTTNKLNYQAMNYRNIRKQTRIFSFFAPQYVRHP